ncbi:hypothetical protein [Arthrobacter sp. UYCu712]|uniref:hypothetical protein n=1 Tax=Arthrobacter sp. UYCu712 TaxID=3156340 RepID=UPI003395E5DA
MHETPDTAFVLMKTGLEAYRQGIFPKEDLINLLMREMAAAEDETAMSFVAEVQNQEPEGDLSYEATRIYKHVQRWKFPEEPELSKALPAAIECTFPELIQSLARAAGQLERVRNMLVGVNVRLDLRDSDMAVGEALRLVTEELRVLERACRKIGDGSGIAPLPDDEAEDVPSWTSPAGSPLSPRQILTLAVQALWNYPDFSVTYAEGLRGHSTPPQLVTERLRAREQQQSLETGNRE